MRVTDDHLGLLLGAWDDGPGPRFRHLADRIGDLIGDGVLGDGALLPTERSFARRLGVSRATVAAALDDLSARGLVESRQGSGSRVRRPRGTPPGPRGTSAMFASLGGVPSGTIDLSLAEVQC